MAKYQDLIIDSMVKAEFGLERILGTVDQGMEVTFRMSGYFIDFFTFYHDVVRNDGKETEFVWNSMWWEGRVMRRMGYPMTEFVWASKCLSP
jgi:hypothetical protein